MPRIKDQLNTISLSIKPIKQSPITIDFFNGENYTANDNSDYPGYTPVVVGSISKDPNDDNYLSEEDFAKLAIDAYYDINAYTNGALAVLGVFNAVPNFSNIPVYTIDQIMRAIAAKLEQNLYTNPSNAETRITLTQSSGGRTTSIPARENFDVKDTLNQKVREYVDGSKIFELVKDSFIAVVLDRNDYYTKEEVLELLDNNSGAIEKLYTLDVENWEPTEPGNGVNYKYVKGKVDDLQSQINALIVGDVELKTINTTLTNPALESLSNNATHQFGANVEFKAGYTLLKNNITAIGKRMGAPLSAFKTLEQQVTTNSPEQIVSYDEVNSGTTDSFGTFDPTNGTYEISQEALGDLVSFDITFTVIGKPLQTVTSGTAYLYRNGELFIHPVTELPVSTKYVLETTAGATISLNAKDIPVRATGTGIGELEVGDILDLRISLSDAAVATNIPHSIFDVHFDMVNMRVLNKNVLANTTANVNTVVPADESISGTAESQEQVNKENKIELEATKAIAEGNTAAIDLLNTELDGKFSKGEDIIILCGNRDSSNVCKRIQTYISASTGIPHYRLSESLDGGVTWNIDLTTATADDIVNKKYIDDSIANPVKKLALKLGLQESDIQEILLGDDDE